MLESNIKNAGPDQMRRCLVSVNIFARTSLLTYPLIYVVKFQEEYILGQERMTCTGQPQEASLLTSHTPYLESRLI